MRVWIISDKRWGESNEQHWIAECSHDPRPDTDPDEQCVWDRVQSRGRRCRTKREAVSVARKLKSNVVNSASVYLRTLEQIDGNKYDWTVMGNAEEVECVYESDAVL